VIARIREWLQGTKHPDTSAVVYKNVWGYDLVRRILNGRCTICDYTLSSDAKNNKEMLFKCDNASCDCARTGNSRTHRVCDLCYNMWHTLYHNTMMKSMNYFKYLDEKDAKNAKRLDGGWHLGGWEKD
jgi:hypothetical protein